MKLHLPVLLRRLLIAAAACSVTVADAAIMHQDVSLITYTDFGQNCGRYSVGNVNALLNYIREQDGGVKIYYKDDSHPAYTMEHGMIDFSSAIDGGYGALIGYNFYATVQHNGVWTGTVTGNTLGGGKALTYVGVEYRSSSRFLLHASLDYKITRLSRLTTDVTPSIVYGQTNRDWSALSNWGLSGQLLYRVGSGTMGVAAYDGSTNIYCGAYAYVTGGLIANRGIGINDASQGAYTVSYSFNASPRGINAQNPLTFRTQAGDSGSPLWIWNTATNQYEYLAAHQARGGDNSYARGAAQWTVNTMESYDKTVSMPSSTNSTAYIYAANTATGTTLTDTAGRTANPYYGIVTDASGNELVRYIGVKSGINTWNNLSSLKDTNNWYAYGSSYFNSSDSNVSTETRYAYADMMQTENLHFVASTQSNTIVVQENTDLGIGYVHLSKKDALEYADYTISGADTYTQLNSAGYVVDDKVSLHLQLTGTTDYMREWRAVVSEQGKLYIEGSGDTNVLLNLGGQGTVYLNRDGGYSAYNVLANNGVAVVISDINQIKRDFTFGYWGGVLDMNGCSMTWNNDNTAESDGFTIHALDEQAIITNMKVGTTTELVWTQGGTQSWLGSFIDSTEGGALHFTYDGGADGVLTMKTIHTALSNEGSGVAVASGKLILSGSNTVHALGSRNGTWTDRYWSAEDWHYADATTDVEIRSGATFELGSHARLTGDVSVAEGASFIVREGVRHQYEYIEGGERLEDTYAIFAYYGLHGNIVNNGKLSFSYSDGTSATNLYTGNISGSGSMEIDLGTNGAILVLSGANTMGGERKILSGRVILDGAKALGTEGETQAWQISEKSWLAVTGETSASLLSLIHENSAGALALGSDTSEQLDMSGHQGLFLGAMRGMSVQYGEAGTTEELAAWHTASGTEDGHGQWLFGGGDGEIIVNWRLRGDNDLVLGNDYMNGTVTLTNIGNDFTGNIVFSDKGNVVLNFTDIRALGASKITLSYGKATSGGSDAADMLAGSTVSTDAAGILLLDNDPDADISLERHNKLHLGANSANVRFTGNIRVNEDGTYYFGGAGTLFLENALVANGTNDIVVDAEGFHGGIIQMNKATEISGNVTIMGYDSAMTELTGINNGSISLRLSADDALKNAASVTVKQGGTLGILQNTTQNITTLTVADSGRVELGNGSILNVNDLQVNRGAYLGSQSRDGEVHVEQGSISGTIEGRTLVKTNSATTLTIEAGNSLACNYVELREGCLTLNADMNIGGALYLYEGSELRLNARAILGGLGVMENVTISSPGISGSTYGGIRGELDIAKDATLSLVGNGFSFRSSTTHLSSGGTLDLSRLGMAQLTTGATSSGQVFLGTVILGNTTLKNMSATEDMSLEFNHLKLTGDAILTHSSWNTNWTVHSLTGEGSLTFNMNSTHWKTTTLTFDGEGDMSGVITAKAANGNTSVDRRFETILQLSHEHAVQNAAISLESPHNRRYVALALNADNVRMKGLSANGYAITYGGEAFAVPQAAAPTTTRNVTLELTGEGDYVYEGGIAGSSQYAINLLKTGSGTQVFTDGKDADFAADRVAVFRDVSVLGGSLSLNTSSTTILGNYAIGQGATLTLDSGNAILDLTDARTLSILAGSDTSTSATSATLNSSLALAGGTISFSGKGMSMIAPDTYLLTFTGDLTARNIMEQNIHFSDASYIEDGRTYYLTTGDFIALGWSASAFTASGVDHYNATFHLTNAGLSVIFSSKGDNLIWHGTDTAHSWTNSLFSTKDIPDGAENFIFTDAAANKEVLIGTDVSYRYARFDSVENYTIVSDGGNLSLNTLEKNSSGDLILQSGITVTGETIVNDGRIILYGNALRGSISGAGTVAPASVDASFAGLVGTIGTLELNDGITASISNPLTADPTQKLLIAKALVHTGATLQINCASTSAVTLDGGILMMAGGSSQSNLTVAADSTLAVASGNATLYNASSLNDATLTLTGGGQKTITAATKVGKIHLQQGTLAIAGGNNVQNLGEITLASDTSLLFSLNSGMSGAVINMQDGSNITLQNGNGDLNHIVNAVITLTGTATIYGSLYGNATLVSGSISGNGTLILSSARGHQNGLTYSAVVSDQGGDSRVALLIKDNSHVTLSGNNTYTGGTTISGATVTANNAHAFGKGVLTMTNGTLTLGGNLFNLTVAAMNDGSGSTVNASDYTLQLTGAGAGTSNSFSAALSGLTLIKSGEGAQAFTNVGNIKQVSVQGGELSLSGSALNLLGAVSVAESATLTLGGNITLAQAIASNGTVNFLEGTVISLSRTDFNSAHRYVVVTGTGTIGDFGLSNFSIDGVSASDLAQMGLSLNVINTGDGTAALYAMLSSLTWNGADGAIWDADSENQVWLNESNAADSYGRLATVSFADNGASKNVTVAYDEDSKPLNVNITGTGFSFSGNTLAITQSLNLAENASATFGCNVQTNRASFNGGSTVALEGELVVEDTLALGGTATFRGAVSVKDLTLSGNANATFEGNFRADSFSMSGNARAVINASYLTRSGETLVVTLADNSCLILGEDGSISVNPASTGTLEVAAQTTVNLGILQDRGNFHLAGYGTVQVQGGNNEFASLNNAFHGTLEITQSNHLYFGTTNAGNQTFVADENGRFVDIILKGGNHSSGFVLNSCYGGTTSSYAHAMNIGSLSGEAESVIRGDKNTGSAAQRYLSLHQTGDTTYAGTFIAGGGVSVGLVMNGTGTITLTNTGNSSTAGLIADSGTIALNGKWAGDAIVHQGGQLRLMQGYTLGGYLTIEGDGVVACGDAAPRRGALVLDNNVGVERTITIAGAGASVMVERGAEASLGMISGSTLTKVGDGALTLSNYTILKAISVESGTLTLNGTMMLLSAIENNASVVFGDDVSFFFNLSDFSDYRYDIVVGNGTTGGALTLDKIFIDGVSADTMGIFKLNGLGGNNVYLSYAESKTLTWNGTADNTTWNDTATNWYLAGAADTDSKFISLDSASFTDAAASKAVVIDQAGVLATNVTISAAGYSFSGGALNLAENLTLESGATATFANNLSVAGDLTLESNATAAFANNLRVTGNLVMAENTKLTLNGSMTISSERLELESGRTLEIGTNIDPVIILRGGTLAVQNNVTFSGVTVAADSYLEVAAGNASLSDKLTVQNNALLTKTGAGTLTLSNKETPGRFRVVGGTLKLSSFDYLYLTYLDLQADTKLILANQWSTLDKPGNLTVLPQIGLADGTVIEMHNGNNNTRVNADIAVDALQRAAVIRGIENGGNMHFEGTISGRGTLQYRSLNEGVRSAHPWAVNSAVTNGSDGALSVDIADVNLNIGGTGVSTYSGGTHVANSSVTVGKASAFGSGTLTMSGSTLILNSNLTIASLSGVAEGNTLTANANTLTLTGAEGTASFAATLTNVSLVKEGVGTQVFTDVQTLGSVAVNGGNLSLSGSAIHLQGEVTVEQSATLTLSGAITLTSPISSNGTVVFDNTSFALASTEFGHIRNYSIVMGSGSTQGDLSLANFTIDGAAVDSSLYELVGTGSGHVYLSYIEVRDLIWNGTAGNSTWVGANWKNDSSTGLVFRDEDSARFTAEAEKKGVSIDAEGVAAKNISVEAAGYVFAGGSLTVLGNVSLADGATAVFGNGVVLGDSGVAIDTAGDSTVKFNGSLSGGALTKTGTGSLTLTSADLAALASADLAEGATILSDRIGSEADFARVLLRKDASLSLNLISGTSGTQLVLNSAGSGKLNVLSGMLCADTGFSELGSVTLQLSDGSGLSFSASGENASTLSNELIIGSGTVMVYAEGTNNFISGNISGSGTLSKIGGGTVALTGDLSGFSGSLFVAADSSGNNCLILETDATLPSLNFGTGGTLMVGNGHVLSLSGISTANLYTAMSHIVADDAHRGSVSVTLGDDGSGTSLDKAQSVRTSYIVSDGFAINSSDGAGSITLEEDGSLDVNGMVQLGQGASLHVAGGTLRAESIRFNRESERNGLVPSFSLSSGTLNLVGEGDLFSCAGEGTAYSLLLSGGTLATQNMGTVAADLTLGGVTFTGAGMSFASGNTLTWDGRAISNDGGVLNFNGNIELDANAPGNAVVTATYSDALDAVSGNGYAALLFAQNTNGGTVSFGEDTSVTFNGYVYNHFESDGNIYLQGNAGIYYVKSGVLAYGSDGNSAASSATTGLSLLANTTITIEQNASLDIAHVEKNGHTLTIDGSGVFINGVGATLNATLANTWAGTVVLSGAIGQVKFNDYGKSANGSTVRCVGLSGWLTLGNLNTAINLEFAKSDDYAFTITATSSRNYEFSGNIKGQGDMYIPMTNDNTVFNFTGDVSGWSGALDIATGSNHQGLKINFSHDGNSDISVSRLANKGNSQLTVEISGSGVKAMNGTLSGANLKMSGSGELTLAQAAELTALDVTGGSVIFQQGVTLRGAASVASHTSLTLGGAISLASAISNEGTVSFREDAAFSILSSSFADNKYHIVTGGGTTHGALSLANFTIDGVAADDFGHYSLVGLETGNLYLSYSDKATLLWRGSEGSHAWSDSNWTAKVGGSAKNFTALDNVRFTDDAHNKTVVADVSGITATTVSIEGTGYSFSGEAIAVQETLSLAQGASASFDTPFSLGESGSLVLGSGSVLSLTGGALDLDNTVSIGEGGATLSLSAAAEATLSSVAGGALTLQGDGSLTLDGVTQVAALTVESGTLNLNGTVTMASSITNSGTLNISDATQFLISQSNFSADNTFVLITNSGTINGSIGLDDISIDGVAANSMERLSIATAENSLYLTYGESLRLFWNGTEGNANWVSRNWLNENDVATSFYNNDSVSFTAAAAEKNVVVDEQGARATNVSILSNGYSFSGGTLTVVGEMTLASGVTAAFSNDVVAGEVGVTLAMADDAEVTFGGTLSGGAIVKTGAGTVTVRGDGLSGLESFSMMSGALILSGTQGDAANLSCVTLGTDATLSAHLATGAEGTILTLNDASEASVRILGGTLRVEGESRLGTGELQMSSDTALSFAGNSTLSNNVGMEGTGSVTLYGTGSENVISGTLSGAAALTLANNANITVTGGLSLSGSVNLNAGSTLKLDLRKAVNLSVAGAGQGTLSVAADTNVNLGNVSGDINYHLAGDGNIEFTSTSQLVKLNSTGNTFNGTLTINLGGSHVLVNSDTFFTADSRAHLVLTGGSGDSSLVLNGDISGVNHVLHIGSLSSSSANAHIRGDYNYNTHGDYRYLSIHQDTTTEFAGSFQIPGHTPNRSTGLIMNGTGRLKLTGNNTSVAKLIVNSGTVEISGASGVWSGDVEVNNGGQLDLQKNNAVASGKVISLAGNGAANSGALNLANDVSLANNISLAAGGAGISAMAETAATISGSISGGALTKLGGGHLTLSGDNTLAGLNVSSGTLTLSGNTTLTGNAVVANQAELILDGTIHLASAISGNGVVSFAENACIALSLQDFTDNIYTVVSGGGSTGGNVSLSHFSINGQNAQTMKESGLNLNLHAENGIVWLTYQPAQTLTWSGTGDGTWGGSNWSSGGEGSEKQEFSQMDSVVFTNAGEVNKAVTVAEEGVMASSITIEGSDYNFSGGSVKAATNLVLADNATASFDSALTVDGSVSLGENATLTVSGGLSVENAPIRVEESRTLAINDGGLGENTTVILDGGTLELGASTVDMSAVTIASDSYVKVTGNAEISLANEGAGGLTKSGSGTLELGFGTTHHSYTVQEGTLALTQGTTTIGNGTGLTVESDGTMSANVIKSSSAETTMNFAGTVSLEQIQMTAGTVKVTGGKMSVSTLMGIWGGTTSISDKAVVETAKMVMVDKDANEASLTISRGGELRITGSEIDSLVIAGWSWSGGTGTLTMLEEGKLSASSAIMQVSLWSGGTGVVNLEGGAVDVKGISFRAVDHDTGSRGTLNLSGGSLTVGESGIKGVQNNVAVNLGNGTIIAKNDFAIGADSGSGALADITLSGMEGTKFDTNGHAVTIENDLGGEGSLVKTGEGTLTLQGTNTYTGTTTVSQGSLALGENAMLYNGSVRIAASENAGGTGELKSAVIDGSRISSAAEDKKGEINSMRLLIETSELTVEDMMIGADTYIGKLSAASGAATRAAALYAVRREAEVGIAVKDSVLKLLADTNATVGATETLETAVVVNDDFTMQAGTKLTTVTCNNFLADYLSGSLTLDFSGIWSGDIVNADVIAVVFEGVSAFGEGTVLSASIPDLSVSPATTYGTLAGSDYAVAYFCIPEPTTGTLSVLALAALAARRRRRCKGDHERG